MFRALLNDKIGTIVRHFAVHIPHLSLTKLLKLLYITDETAMRETGSPITWLEYRVWKHGPVPAEIFQEIKHGEKMTIAGHLVSLDQYIQVNKQTSAFRPGKEEVYIDALGPNRAARPCDNTVWKNDSRRIGRILACKRLALAQSGTNAQVGNEFCPL
jgi:Protein of unknown function (DUF4065)